MPTRFSSDRRRDSVSKSTEWSTERYNAENPTTQQAITFFNTKYRQV